MDYYGGHGFLCVDTSAKKEVSKEGLAICGLGARCSTEQPRRPIHQDPSGAMSEAK